MVTGLWYGAVLAVTGLAGSAWVLAGVSSSAAGVWKRRVGALAVIAAGLLIAAVAGRLWSQTHQAFGGDAPLDWLLVRVIVTETPWGAGWTWQALGALSCLAAALAMRNALWRWPLAIATAVPTAFATALTGHAVGMDEGVWITVGAQGTHVVAAGLWLGTLAALLVITRGSSSGDESAGPFADAIGRFSRVAQPAVAVLVVTGLVATWRHVGGVANFATPYGFVLGLKVAAFLGAAACGLYNWRRISPTLRAAPGAGARLRRVAWLEVGCGAIALTLTAVVGSLPMPGHDH